jgi:glycosyltransferase involved in cell wall biosynthesis
MIDFTSVSIVIPVLNEERHLENAVNSVLEQHFEGEILLVLGPSSDKTDKIAEGLAKKDKRIRLVPNPRGLTTVGMNLAIKQAKHDVIVRIDAHSQPAANYISRGLEILERSKADLLGGVMAAKGSLLFQRAVAWATIAPWVWVEPPITLGAGEVKQKAHISGSFENQHWNVSVAMTNRLFGAKIGN